MKKFSLFANSYLDRLKSKIDLVDHDELVKIIHILEDAHSSNSRIYVAGNGGSAATAAHIVNDLGSGLKRRNIKNFDIHSSSDNSASITAIANDIGYEKVFVTQVSGILRSNDVILAISASGNSPNIIQLCDYAKNIGCKIIGLTGFDGGYLKKISDVSYHVETQKGEYGLVEDMHMIFDHLLFTYYLEQFK